MCKDDMKSARRRRHLLLRELHRYGHAADRLFLIIDVSPPAFGVLVIVDVSRGEKASVPFAQLSALSIILWTAVSTDPTRGLPHARVYHWSILSFRRAALRASSSNGSARASPSSSPTKRRVT